MKEEKKEVHICPILMRTVIFIDKQCTEECSEECPIDVFFNEKDVDVGLSKEVPNNKQEFKEF